MATEQKHLNPLESFGADPSNTAPSSSNTGGFDTLEVSVYGRFTGVYLGETWHKLHRARDCAQHGDEQHSIVHTPGGRVLHVHRSGGGRGKAYLPYRVECEGYTILLGGPMAKSEERIAKVQIGSLQLMSKGHRHCWEQAQEILEEIGVIETKNVVSRADVCVDLPGIPVTEFVELWAKGYRVTRARKGGSYVDGRKATGFDQGVTGCRVRIYDKTLEMRGQEGTAKFCALRDNRWGGVVPMNATRVEFQTRRDFIRDTLNVQSVEDYFDKVGDITRLLVKEWFRLTADDPDAANKNQTKARDAEVWQRVVRSFASWAGQVTHRVERRKGPLPDLKALEAQLVGVLETIAAACPRLMRDDDAIHKLATRTLARVKASRPRGDTVRKRIAHKRALLASTGELEWLQDQQQVNQREAWETHPSDCFCETCAGR